MGFFDKIFGSKAGISSPQSTMGQSPTFKHKKTANNGNIYEIYTAPNPVIAQEFVKTKKIENPNYYIIVETPEGNWGVDKEGIFLEHLEPWQIFLINSADCEGRFIPLSWSSFGLEMAARGLNDNFVCDAECGKCKERWTVGIRYQNRTAVRCPKCRAVNIIDSSTIEVFIVDDSLGKVHVAIIANPSEDTEAKKIVDTFLGTTEYEKIFALKSRAIKPLLRTIKTSHSSQDITDACDYLGTITNRISYCCRFPDDCTFAKDPKEEGAAVHFLTEALKDDFPDVRRLAAIHLGKFLDKTSTPTLESISLNDPEPDVRTAASMAKDAIKNGVKDWDKYCSHGSLNIQNVHNLLGDDSAIHSIQIQNNTNNDALAILTRAGSKEKYWDMNLSLAPKSRGFFEGIERGDYDLYFAFKEKGQVIAQQRFADPFSFPSGATACHSTVTLTPAPGDAARTVGVDAGNFPRV